MAGSLTGAVASERVTEACEGELKLDGNQLQSAMAKARLTERPTSRSDTKVGHSDPVDPNGRSIAQRIKGTPGITGLSPPRVHIDGEVWHLDVGSSHPGAEAGPKGLAVRQLKWYVSWVQNVVRQFGPYLPWVYDKREELLLVREDRSGRITSVPVVTPVAELGSHNTEEITAESI